MPTTTHPSYCRICQASCGMLVSVRDGRVESIMGDRDNPLSEGFSCPKGRRAADFMHGRERLTGSLARDPAGRHVPIDAFEATEQVGRRLSAIIAEHGPDAIGMFMGTQHNFATLTKPVAQAWFGGTGSRKLFSTMTIDQSAKWVAAARMGEYRGGRQSFHTSDVWILAGTNPLVSVNGGAADGVLMHNPAMSLRTARARGLKLIVIDPRRSETAHGADIHLAPRPGYDAMVLAGLLNVILSEKLHDAAFCARFANGLDRLTQAVGDATPMRVEQVTGICADDLIGAARLFARGPRGMISTGTGLCMGPDSNVAEHLASCLNVVCGRYQREGEKAFGPAVLLPDAAPRAEVGAPARSWESGFRSRLGPGLLNNQLPSANLADEILAPGPDRIRALIVSGGNPAIALPDARKAHAALASLELLVTIDTRMTETARLADYVIAPAMLYERADHTMMMEFVFPKSYAMFTNALVEPPPGVIEDWQFFYHLARTMGQPLKFAGMHLDMATMPDADTLLRRLASRSRVPLDVVASAPHGYLAPERTTLVAAASEDAAGNRLDLLPADVAQELRTAIARPAPGPTEMRLVVRRMREVMNSLGREIDRLPSQPYNPAHLHPDDIARLGLSTNDVVRLTTAHGSVRAVVHSDGSMQPGILALTHCWGGLDDGDEEALGCNVNSLTGSDALSQTINSMPVLSAFPVRLERCA